MALLGTPLDDLTLANLQALVDGGTSEGRTLDFKVELPGGVDADKKEFLADITALANADGGHILYGVAEAAGAATGLPGVEVPDVEAEVLRLDGVVRAGVAPRIPNVDIAAVPVADGRHVVVLEVPRSFARPHMVTFKGTNRFFLRHAAGKAPMTIDEIRTVFSLSDSVIERVRRFRRERLEAVKAGETPFSMGPGPYIVMHLLPLSMYDPAQQFELFKRGTVPLIRPIYSSGWNTRINFDGFAAWAPSREGPCETYSQLYRSGAIEGVLNRMFRQDDSGNGYLAILAFEKEMGEALRHFREIQGGLGVQLPVILAVSLLGVKGYAIPSGSMWDAPAPFDRDDLMLPEIVIDESNAGEGVMQILRPAIDAVWNAGGYADSPNYEDDGTWVERRR